MKDESNVIVTGKEVESTKWWKKIHIKPIYVFIGILVIILVSVIYYYLAKPYANEFVCTSGHSKVFIKYVENRILYLQKKNINFEIENKNEETLMDDYLLKINENFYNMSGEYCKVNETIFILSQESSNNNLLENLVEVGNYYYGYLDIPASWSRVFNYSEEYLTFTDETYSINILYDEEYKGTVDEYFEEYRKMIEDDFNNNDIKISSEVIGNSNDYIANVLNFYNQGEKKYYITYIFGDENNEVHHIELSGPQDLKKYSFIPKSFRK